MKYIFFTLMYYSMNMLSNWCERASYWFDGWRLVAYHKLRPTTRAVDVRQAGVQSDKL